MGSSRAGDFSGLIEQLTAEPAARPAHPVALAGGVRYARSLERVDLSRTDVELPLREGGRYLITGGAGGLGVAVGAYLAREHGARVRLVGRRASGQLTDQVRSLLAELPEQVTYASADVTDEAALRSVVAGMRQDWGGVDGVVHSAFVLNDRTLSRMDERTLRSSFGPKRRTAPWSCTRCSRTSRWTSSPCSPPRSRTTATRARPITRRPPRSRTPTGGSSRPACGARSRSSTGGCGARADRSRPTTTAAR
ncbi:SDR family NAD(P)-dependent oxidoreductase [Streptomyces sp. S1A(2023)]